MMFGCSVGRWLVDPQRCSSIRTRFVRHQHQLVCLQPDQWQRINVLEQCCRFLRDATDSKFVFTGDSAVATLGSTETILGTKETFPNRILVANNRIHGVAVFGKQTSCYFQALATNVTLRDKVCYNGPRAGMGCYIRYMCAGVL